MIIVVSIFKQQAKMKTSTGNRVLQSNLRKQAMMLVTLSLLFGLGWGLGLAATRSLPIISLRTIFEIAFIVLTGFQGLFIFLLYGARLEKVRCVWLKWFYLIFCQYSRAAKLELTRSRSTRTTSGSRLKPAYNLGSYQDSSETKVQLNCASPTQQSYKSSDFGSSTPSPPLSLPLYSKAEGEITDFTVKQYSETSTFQSKPKESDGYKKSSEQMDNGDNVLNDEEKKDLTVNEDIPNSFTIDLESEV